MKLHLMPRKLIINKITSVKAITDNNCVKEVLMCECVGRRLNGHSAFISTGRASQGQRLGPDKDTISPFFGSFFFFFSVSHGV